MGNLAKRVDEHVGERVRLRRTQMGLTQEHLALALAISYQQIQKYETGANRVSAGRLFEIAQRLEVTMSYFFEGLEPRIPNQPMEHGGKNRSTIELVRNFAEIKDTGVRSAVSGLIKSLAGRPRRRSALPDGAGEAPPSFARSGIRMSEAHEAKAMSAPVRRARLRSEQGQPVS